MTDDPVYGTTHEAIEALREVLPPGIPVPSIMTIRRAAKRGKIRTWHVGDRLTYFNLDDVRAWGGAG